MNGIFHFQNQVIFITENSTCSIFLFSTNGKSTRHAKSFEIAGIVEIAERFEILVKVCAINATTVVVDFASDVVAGSFTFNGVAVDAANVAIAGDKATLTVPAMTDNTKYTVVFTPADTNVAPITTDVTYDIHQLTSITTDAPAVTNAVVGSEVSVAFTLKDEDGDAVANEKVRVRSLTGSTVNKEETLTSDANGQVTFKYTSVDGRTDTVEAVALSKPTLRTSVSVEWVETAAAIQLTNPTKDGFIVDTVATVPAETKTIKYVAKFVDANGAALADGTKVYVNLAGMAGTFTGGANNEFGTAVAGTLRTATLDNGDGTAILEFTDNAAETITPTFFQDADQGTITSLASFTTQDARLVAKSVVVVNAAAQTPTFTLALQEGATVNQKVTAVNGGYEVQQGSTVEYTLTAVDQYGNPFVGTAKLSHKALLDNLAANDTAKGSIQFDSSEDEAASYGNTNVTSVAFGTVDADGDGKVEVQLSAGAANDLTNLVVWVDKDADSALDSDEVKVEAAQVKYVSAVTPSVTSMSAVADKTSTIGTAAVVYSVDLKSNDAAFDASGDAQDVIVKLYKNGVLVDQDAAGTGAVTAANDGGAITPTVGDNAVIAGINAADGKFTFTVTPDAAEAGSVIYPVVTLDLNGNGTVEADETVTVQGPSFNVIAEPDSYKLALSKTAVTAGETVNVTITALDSTSAVETDFDGQQVVEVLLAANTGVAAAGVDKTYLRTANFVDGVATIAVPVELVANDDILVTLPVGTSKTAGYDGDADTGTAVANDTDFTVTAAAASKLGVNGSDELLLVDQYGNTAATANKAVGLATVTVNGGTFSGTLSAEHQMQIQVVNGAVKTSTGTALTYTGTTGNSLTITFADGTTYTISK